MGLYETLSEEVISFCKPIIDSWQDVEVEMSRSKLQQQFLYSQARGAYITFESYQLLKSDNRPNECKILCRTLLERLARSLYARERAENAVELVIGGINSEISARGRQHDFSKGKGPLKRIETLEKDLGVLESLMIGEKYDRQKKIYKLFEESGIEHFYRGCYAEYCDYSHGGFLTAISNKELTCLDEYFSLLCPVVAAHNLHESNCSETNCPVGVTMKSLVSSIGRLLSISYKA